MIATDLLDQADKVLTLDALTLLDQLEVDHLAEA